MRWAAGLMVLIAACVPGGQPADPAAKPTPAPVQASDTAPGNLPAVEPQLPTLAEFRRRAVRSCAAAAGAVRSVPLNGDPLHPDARPVAVSAAIAHYRAAASAWSSAAGDLFDFGVPEQRVGQQLITALDTLAQYSHQTAELLQAGDRAGAQSALGAVDEAGRIADRHALRLGIGRLAECGASPLRLPSARRVGVDADDFSFTVGELAPGPTRFVVTNRGVERHQLFVVRLADAGTLDDAVRADREQDIPVPFLRRRRAVSRIVDAGQRTTLDMRLPAGVYGLLCFVASPDGTPHAYKGMALEASVPN